MKLVLKPEGWTGSGATARGALDEYARRFGCGRGPRRLEPALLLVRERSRPSRPDLALQWFASQG